MQMYLALHPSPAPLYHHLKECMLPMQPEVCARACVWVGGCLGVGVWMTRLGWTGVGG